MSMLSGILGSGAGLGGAPSAGAYSGGSLSFVPPYTATGGISGLTSLPGQAAGSLMQGKLSLAVLEVAIIGLVGFYIWTHAIQGGG